jgi:hypothetical protein
MPLILGLGICAMLSLESPVLFQDLGSVHRVVTSRSLLFHIVSHYLRQLITTLTHGHRWQPDVGFEPQLNPQLRYLSFRVTTIYTTPTSSMASFVHVILAGQLLVHLRNISNAE